MEERKRKAIAIDMMGSDLGVDELSFGVIRFLKENKDIDLVLYGDKDKLIPIFKDIGRSQITIVDTKDIVPMEIKPLEFLRLKDSSMYQGISSIKEGRCDAFISAGSTGGLVSGSTILLRLIDGITKAGIVTCMPTMKDKPSIVMDVGANNYCNEVDLLSFAYMAKIIASYVYQIDNPTISLLSNGVEKGKGTDEIVAAYKLFKEKKIDNFIGNVEARDALDGNHDIIITSGFAGNIFLKSVEGSAKLISSLLKKGFKKNLFTRIGYLFSKSGLSLFKKKLDYKQYGGALLLGVNGIIVKAHGSSDQVAFYNAINITKKMINNNVLNLIKEEVRHD